ncbi:MAG TPA: protein kinase [Terriglobales bacterium]|nr:protein kinase [Terriglobales bacterium]
MSLESGKLLGPYQIISPAGAGGMGEVYKALDTRLERTVAIKVLPGHLSADPDLKQRFEREARAISSLQHPYICTLFDVGSQDGVDYLVMEYLEGETLGERLQKGALTIEQTLKTGIEIADALDRAHKQGILHRDLKPGNIMMTKSGAKLMDFGLAKPSSALAMSASGKAFTGALTRTSPANPITQMGTVVGTFQYMSPEQLEGSEADARSDIFGLGAVLYEMATGKRAFEGKSQISVMSAILEKEPEPISTIQPATPPAFEHVVNRALAKDPDERWQTAADLRSELKWISQTSSSVRAVSPGVKRKKYQKWMALAGVAVATVAITALAMWLLGVGRSPEAVQAFILPPEGGQFVFTGQNAGPPVISPDGTKVVFQASSLEGKRILWVRWFKSLTPLPIAGTEGAMYPFWSPDNKEIAFFQTGRLKRVDVAGGPVTSLGDAAAGRGGSWNEDGVIIFSPGTSDGISKVSSTGGTPELVTKVQPTETSHRWPWFLPDGKHFLYLAWNQGGNVEGDAYTVYATSLAGGDRKLVLTGATSVAFANGYLLFLRGSNLMAQKFDVGSLKVEGTPFPMFERVQTDPQFGRGNFSASQTGSLVFVNGPSASEAKMNWVSLEGKELGQIGGSGNWSGVRISPDGKTLATTLDPGNADVWLLSLAREMRSRLTFDPAPDLSPIWSPDGKKVAFSRYKTGSNQLMVRFADGSGSEEVLLQQKESAQASDWSRDGRYITFNTNGAGQGTDIWILPTFGDKKPFPFLATQFSEADGMFSPDGNWIIYDSPISGTSEIYAAPFPGPGGKFQISSGGGDWPRWTRDGKHVTYVNGDDYYMGDVSYDKIALQVTNVRKIFTMPSVGASSTYSYDIGPDNRVLLVSSETKAGTNRLAWISDWRKQLPK